MPELAEQARGWLSALRSTFEARHADYAWAEVVGGYSTSEREPVIAHLVIRFHPNEDSPTGWRIGYPHFTLFSRAVDPVTGWGLFEALTRGEQISIGNEFPTLRFGNCNLDQPSRHGSKSYPFSEPWPVDVGLLNGTPDGRLRHELLASRNGPLYTGPQEAINETTGVPVGWRGYAPTVYVLMPDRRARIREPRISTKAISGVIERGPVPTTGLVLRGYASSVGSAARNRERLDAFAAPSRFEVDEPEGPFSFGTGFFPNHLILAVIEKESDVLLDQREYESERMTLANDISFEADAAHVEGLIGGGESDRVEFKETFEGGDGWLRTVCAFSNGGGGVIFFGVKDDASVVGLTVAKTSDQVAQKIRGSLEPFPSYQFVTTELQGKQIAYVDVASGPEKPYSVREHGVFVRAQATTRQATRHELLLLASAALANP